MGNNLITKYIIRIEAITDWCLLSVFSVSNPVARARYFVVSSHCLLLTYYNHVISYAQTEEILP